MKSNLKTTRKQIITWPSWFTLVVLWKVGSAAMYRNEKRSWHSNTPPKKHKLKVNEPSWKLSPNYDDAYMYAAESHICSWRKYGAGHTFVYVIKDVWDSHRDTILNHALRAIYK